MPLIYFIFLFLFFPLKGWAESQYHPPMEPPLIVTGTFGELRSTHFHGGVDFSTQRKTGKKIFSIDEGFVSRIKVAPDGYGNALYIKLKDGNTAVYGHLKSFTEPISKRVLEEQERLQNSFVDFELNPEVLPVARGELIGWSGDSGGVPPHLHFELRDPQEKLLNPLVHALTLPDTTQPKIKNLALVPLNKDFVRSNKDGWQLFIPNWDASKGEYHLPDQTISWEKIGLEVAVEDESFGNVCAPMRVALYEGEKLLFERNYHSFSFEEFPHPFVVYNRHFWLEEKGSFERLYSFPYSSFSFQKFFTKERGVLHFQPGETKNIQILVEDAARNKTTLKLALTASAELKNPSLPQKQNASVVLPKKSFKWEDSKGWVDMKFPKKSVYYPTLLSIEELSQKTFKPVPFKSPVLSLKPKDALFQKEIELNFLLPEGEESHLYVYHEKNKKWKYVKNQSRRKNKIRAKIKSFGVYALLEDPEPPMIKPIRLRKDPRRLTFQVKDNLSDIDYRNIQIRHDEKPLIFVVNRNKTEIEVPQIPTKGKIYIEVPDKAQNAQTLIIDLSK